MDYLSQFSFLTDEMNSFNLDNTKSNYNDLLFILKKLIYSKNIDMKILDATLRDGGFVNDFN